MFAKIEAINGKKVYLLKSVEKMRLTFFFDAIAVVFASKTLNVDNPYLF